MKTLLPSAPKNASSQSRLRYVDNEGYDRIPAGMAGLPGSCPDVNQTCRTCAFWGGNTTMQLVPGMPAKQVVNHTRRRWAGTAPMAQACGKYRLLRRQQALAEDSSRRVPAETPACRYFEAYDNPQPKVRPPKVKRQAKPKRKRRASG